MFRIKSEIPCVNSYVNFDIYYAYAEDGDVPVCTKVAIIAIAYF